MLFGSEASTLHSPVPQVFKLRNAFVNKQNAQKTSKQTKTFCKRFTSGLLHLQLAEMTKWQKINGKLQKYESCCEYQALWETWSVKLFSD